MTIKPEVLAAMDRIWRNKAATMDAQIVKEELTRLSEIADTVDPLVVRLGEVTEKVESQTKMLADCYRMSGADPDGNEDWRIARYALRAVTDLRRDYDEVEDWQLKCMNAETRLERADALLQRARAYHVLHECPACPVDECDACLIESHLSVPRT